MPELEQRLRALAPAAFPPVPELSGAVGERLRAGGAPAPPPRLRPRRALVVALAALVIPAGAIAAVPATRDAVADWLGLRHVKVERVERLPRLPALRNADLGERVDSVAAASKRAGFAVQVPAALGPPDAVYVADDAVVSLAYDARPGLPRDRLIGLGLLVTELEVLEEPDLLKKALAPGTRVEGLNVDGAPGVFISGKPHEVLVVVPGDRRVVPIPPRLAGNTLAFERDGLVIRLEARFGKRAALALARSVAR